MPLWLEHVFAAIGIVFLISIAASIMVVWNESDEQRRLVKRRRWP